MAGFKKQPNRGFFGKNNKKTNERQPDYTGSLLIGEDTLAQMMADKAAGKPVMLYLSGWKNTPQAGGEPYISLACNAPQPKAVQGSQQRPAARRASGQDEDVPF